MAEEQAMRRTRGGRLVPKPKKKMRVEIAKKKKQKFLRKLAECGVVKYAAQAAGYTSATNLYRYRQEDEEFAKKWDEAEKVGTDVLEAEAFRRAVRGVEKGIYFKGVKVDTELVYSDGLLQTLLKAKKPEVYGERKQVDVNVGGQVGVAVLPMASDDASKWEEESQAINEENQKSLQLEDQTKEQQESIDAEFEIVKETIKRA